MSEKLKAAASVSVPPSMMIIAALFALSVIALAIGLWDSPPCDYPLPTYLLLSGTASLVGSLCRLLTQATKDGVALVFLGLGGAAGCMEFVMFIFLNIGAFGSTTCQASKTTVLGWNAHSWTLAGVITGYVVLLCTCLSAAAAIMIMKPSYSSTARNEETEALFKGVMSR